MTAPSPGARASPRERGGATCLAELPQAQPEVETVDLILPDLAGIARGKRLVADAFDAALSGGLGLPSSIYGVDSTGANVAASGLIWERGDADLPCLVDPTSLAEVPWRDGGAQVLAGLGEQDGRPFFADPRAVLKSVAARFEATACPGLRARARVLPARRRPRREGSAARRPPAG